VAPRPPLHGHVVHGRAAAVQKQDDGVGPLGVVVLREPDVIGAGARAGAHVGGDPGLRGLRGAHAAAVAPHGVRAAAAGVTARGSVTSRSAVDAPVARPPVPPVAPIIPPVAPIIPPVPASTPPEPPVWSSVPSLEPWSAPHPTTSPETPRQEISQGSSRGSDRACREERSGGR